MHLIDSILSYSVLLHSSGQTALGFPHIEGITLGENEEVAEGASGMNGVRIGEVGDRASEGQVAKVYETCFPAGSLARVGGQRLKLVLTRN